MTHEPRIGRQGRDDEVTRVLRAMFAPPADPAYWNALERAIMARLAGEGERWWDPFRAWLGAGLLAAGIALAVAGAVLTRARETEAVVAYEAVIETPRSPQLEMATEPEGAPLREATLRYVIAP